MLSLSLSLSLSCRRGSLLTLGRKRRCPVKKDVASPARLSMAGHVHWADICSNLKSSSGGIDSLVIVFNRSFYTSVVGFDGLPSGIFAWNIAWFSDSMQLWVPVKGFVCWILRGYLGSNTLITFPWILWRFSSGLGFLQERRSSVASAGLLNSLILCERRLYLELSYEGHGWPSI